MVHHQAGHADVPRPSSQAERTLADLLLDELVHAGVHRMFGVPGGPLLGLLDAVRRRSDIEFVLAKHEEGAVFMAEGHARVTGDVGVACVTAGPGTTHALTALASANSDGVPVLLVAGQVSTALFGRGALQDSSGSAGGIDTVDVFRSATKASIAVTDPSHFPTMLDRALRSATTGRRGAVLLSVPGNVLASPAPNRHAREDHPHALPRAGAQELSSLITALTTSRKSLLFAGQGAHGSVAPMQLARLAELLGAGVATTMKGKSVMPEDHFLSIGVFGNYGGSPRSHAAVLDPEIDLVLVLGSSLGEVSTFGWNSALVDDREVWQVDLDPLQFNRAFPIHRGIVSDAGTLVDDLLSQLPQLPASGRFGPSETRAPMHRVTADELQADHTVLRASAVAARLSTLIPPDTHLFIDNGNALCWIGEHLVSRDGVRVFTSLNMGSMGYTVPMAIGASLARPEAPTVAVLGDASFAMTGMELHTAVETGAAVIWIVLNNSGNAMVANLQELLFGTPAGSAFAHPLDIAMIARGLGVEATTVTDLDSFSDAFQRALDSNLSWLLDVHVDPAEIPWSLQRRAEVLRNAS